MFLQFTDSQSNIQQQNLYSHTVDFEANIAYGAV